MGSFLQSRWAKWVLLSAGVSSVGLLVKAANRPAAPAPTAVADTLSEAEIKAATHMRPPRDELATIQLPPGYHLELIASDPDVISPTALAWDGDGRMYVAEMRSYMPDINGNNEKDPISRVSRWEDTKGDGVYDKHTVFADKLMSPANGPPAGRPYPGPRDRHQGDLLLSRHQGRWRMPTRRCSIYQGRPVGATSSTRPSGLLWNIDNWIYTTYEPTRYRFTHGKMETEQMHRVQVSGGWR